MLLCALWPQLSAANKHAQPLVQSSLFAPSWQQSPSAQLQWLLEQGDDANLTVIERLQAYRLAASLWQTHRAQCLEEGFSEAFLDRYLTLLLNDPTAKNVDEAVRIWHQRRAYQLSAALGEQCLPKPQSEALSTGDLQDDVVVVHLMFMGNQVKHIVSTKGQPRRVISTLVDVDRVLSIAARYSSALKLNETRALRYSSLLYKWLLAPVEVELAKKPWKVVQLQVDERLLGLPWVALRGSESKSFAGEQWPLVVGSGVQGLTPETARLRHKTLFASLRPSYIEKNLDQDYAPLPRVINEWDYVRRSVKAKALWDKHFNQQKLEEKLIDQDVSILHMATHGELSGDGSSFIMLNSGPMLLSELGELVRARKYSWLPLRLITLSACSTAATDTSANNRLGLAGAALEAGARSALASLWAVDDRYASEFMNVFYQALASQKTVATAASHARQQLRASGWSARDLAAFQIYGEGL